MNIYHIYNVGVGVLATAVLLWAFSLGPEAEAERSMGPVLRRARAHGVDLLRLVLALVVLFSHAFAETGNQAVEPLGLLTGGQIWLGQLATNVFFALSGYFSEASLARRLRCTAAATAAAPVACVREFLEARVRALVPLLSFFALVTAGALGPWLSGADYAAYSASAWRFIAALCAPFVTNTGPTATLGAGGLRGVPTLAGFERLPRAVDAVDFGIAGSLHTVQILWRCYLHIALLALCCAKRARDFRLAALIGGAWSACVLASGCGLLHVDVACFAIGAAYSASGASDAQRRGVFHRWQCAAATGPAVLGLAALLARRGDVSAAVALAVPFLLHWSLAAATAPCAERVGVALLGSIDPSGALATQVWIWGSLIQRIALRSTLLLAWSGGGAVAGGTDGSGVGGSGGRGKPFPSCVAVAEEEDLATLAGEMGRQLIEVERARCSVPSALAAFVMAAPLTLAAAVIAERARARWVHTDVFLGIAICVSVGRMFITS